MDEVLDEADGDGKFALGWWVLAPVALYLAFKGEPVAAFGVI